MRHILWAALLGSLCLAAPVRADSLQAEIVAQLHEQGYRRVTVSRTFLGRIRINAELGHSLREIVVNPLTGEILRDMQVNASRHAGNRGTATGAEASFGSTSVDRGPGEGGGIVDRSGSADKGEGIGGDGAKAAE